MYIHVYDMHGVLESMEKDTKRKKSWRELNTNVYWHTMAVIAYYFISKK